MEWLVEILKNAGIEDVDNLEKLISKEIPKYFKPAKEFNEKTDRLKAAEGEIETLKKSQTDIQTEYDNYKKGSISQSDYEKKAKEIEENAKSQMDKIIFDHKLEKHLASAGAKNATALKALLKMENISLDKDNFIGLEEQLKTIKESDAYLFNTEIVKNQGAGNDNNHKRADNYSEYNQEDLDKLSDAEYYAKIENKKG